MEVYAGHRDGHLAPLPSVVTIGVFDGVHLGHQALVAETVARARGAGLRALALTFHPHPAHHVRPGRAPRLLEPLAWRAARLAQAGIDALVVEPFDAALAAMSAPAFVAEVLVRRLGARQVVVGENFRFGRDQEGGLAELAGGAGTPPLAVRPLAPVQHEGAAVSSSRVRACLRDGRPRAARALLGRPFCLAGRVERGAQRGTGLGFPTANLRADNEMALPLGVYAAWAQLDAALHPAVVNVGCAPTFAGDGATRVEAHLLAYAGPSFYGARLALAVDRRLRQERRFAGVEALVAQIRADSQAADAALADVAPPDRLLSAELLAQFDPIDSLCADR